jgi:hypothetical protein
VHTQWAVINYAMELNQLALRQAYNEGLRGEALASRVADLRLNPPADIQQATARSAREASLAGQQGAVMQRITAVLNHEFDLPILRQTQLFKFIDPFVRISGQLTKQAIDRTPLAPLVSGEARADLMGRNGPAAQDYAIAKMGLGLVYGLTVAGLVAEGYMNGSGPENKDENFYWRTMLGNQPHAVRVGDFWVPINRLGRVGLYMSMMADMYQTAHHLSEGDLQKATAMAMHGISQNILDEGPMKGIGDLLRAVEDSGRYGESYVRNTLSSYLIPNEAAYLARTADPYQRQVHTTWDAIKAKLPYLSQTLPPKIDLWGNPVPNDPALLSTALTSLRYSQASRDPTTIELARLQKWPGLPLRKLRNIELTDPQYVDYANMAGRLVKRDLDRMVNSPQWPRMLDDDKRNAITQSFKANREAAANWLFRRYPQIPADATNLKREKKLKIYGKET